jgi:8-amino-3,8-dideoxy-alpha-D-manno-octulosonate transaminase
VPGLELIGEEELKEVVSVFKAGGTLARFGFDNRRGGIYKVREFENAVSEMFGSTDALAVSSGTAALRVALAALGVGPGDEVVTQSFTFVATVEAIVESGAIPVICEVDETLNMDPVDLARKISAKTKAVIPVHMLGTPARMNEILELSRRNSIAVLEDTAWGCGGKLNNIPLGALGDAGIFSFDYAKAITTGEGGMVISHSTEILSKARAFHDHGHENNPNLPRWEDSRTSSGFNFRMSELQGAVGLAQLKKLNRVVDLQRQAASTLMELLTPLGVQFREEPTGSHSTFDSFVFLATSSAQALAIRSALIENGQGTKILPEALTWHFARFWNHIPELSGQYENLGNEFGQSFELLSRAVSIPISLSMSNKDFANIYKSIEGVLSGR